MSWSVVIPVGTSVLLALFGLLFAAIKWLLDRYQAAIEQRFNSLDRQHRATEVARTKLVEQVAAVEGRLNELRVELPRDYVHRTDWIRAWSISDSKMDTLNEKLERLKDVLLTRPRYAEGRGEDR